MRVGKRWILNIVGIIIVLIYLFPVYWMIVSSLKSKKDLFQNQASLLPKGIDLNGYFDVISQGILQNSFNSFLISFSAMAIVILLGVPCAYGLARFKLPGLKSFILLFLITQMLPPTVIVTPLFIMFSKIHILDTYFAPIVASATLGIPFTVIILRTYFLETPKEIEDAARIDGCNKFTAFLRVVIPITKPGIIVCAAISFMFAWGDLIFNLTFNRNQDLWPLTTSVYNSIGMYGVEWNSLMSFATISVLPVIILFLLLQKQIVKGLASGAVK